MSDKRTIPIVIGIIGSLIKRWTVAIVVRPKNGNQNELKRN